MDFSEALKSVKEGKKIARIGWNGSGMFAFLIKGAITKEGVYERPYFLLFTAQKDLAHWVPSCSDILANDWTIVEKGDCKWNL